MQFLRAVCQGWPRNFLFWTFVISWNQKWANKQIIIKENEILSIDFHAVGMAIARPLGFEIDFARNPISGSAAWFFVIIVKFIFTAIFEIKKHVKNSLTPKKFHFRSPIFINEYPDSVGVKSVRVVKINLM